MSAPSQDLQPLVVAAAAGDREAFASLVQATQSTVCAITIAITGELASSEDVAQDVFVAAWTGIGQLRDPASFPAGPSRRWRTRGTALSERALP